MTAEQLDALTKMGDELTAVEECIESMRLEAQEDREETRRAVDSLIDTVNIQNAHLAAICAKLGVPSELRHVPRRPHPAARIPEAAPATEADSDAPPWA
jgi:hypothetical protein